MQRPKNWRRPFGTIPKGPTAVTDPPIASSPSKAGVDCWTMRWTLPSPTAGGGTPVVAPLGHVTFDENQYWKANKAVFGESTTEQQKALAYRPR